MQITEVESFQKGKYKIYLNNEFAFVLYRGELKKYQIEIGNNLSEADYNRILREVLIKRATKRAMHLLQSTERTEDQLRRKLKENLYPARAIQEAVDYVKSYHYIDDEAYARRFLTFKSSIWSRKKIEMELMNKGISKTIIQSVLEEENEDTASERELLQNLMKKKWEGLNPEDPKSKEKLFRYLVGKGFSYSDISDAYEHLT